MPGDSGELPVRSRNCRIFADDGCGCVQRARKTHLEPAEIEAWKRAAEAMYVPYDEKLNIIPRATKVAADRRAALLA